MRVLGENAKINLRANFYNIFNELNLNPTSISNNISFDGVTNNSNFWPSPGSAGRPHNRAAGQIRLVRIADF